MPTELETRVTRLEERLSNRIESDNLCNLGIQNDLKDIYKQLQLMQSAMIKQKGFIGGVVFVIGGVATVASILFNKFYN